jgi:hypothetical protein
MKTNKDSKKNIFDHNENSIKDLIKDEKVLARILKGSEIQLKEKEKYGKVFTPLNLIYDIVIKLPKEVWTKPSLKWIDTSCGIGNIMIVVYYLLMANLKAVSGYEDDAIRSKHIIEKMLYMIEFTAESANICKELFQLLNAAAQPNIIQADFLNDAAKWKEAFSGVEMFDLNIGNPPYNIDGTKHKGQKNVYVPFVLKGLTHLNKEGYLVQIHPPAYRVANHRIQSTQMNLNEVYTNKQILFIRMFNVETTKELMGVMMNVDYIILKNVENTNTNTNTKTKTKTNTNTTLIDVNNEQHQLQIYPNMFIPNYGFSILTKLANWVKKNGNVEIVLNSEMHAQTIEGTQYKNIHGIKKKGLKICFSNKPHSLHYKRKFIINGIGTYNYVFYDEKGEYGLTQSPVAIIEPNQNTRQLIQSKLFHYIVDATKIIGNNFNKKTSLFLPLIADDKVIIHNEKELYNYLKFSSNEISEIERYSIPTFLNCEL